LKVQRLAMLPHGRKVALNFGKAGGKAMLGRGRVAQAPGGNLRGLRGVEDVVRTAGEKAVAVVEFGDVRGHAWVGGGPEGPCRVQGVLEVADEIDGDLTVRDGASGATFGGGHTSLRLSEVVAEGFQRLFERRRTVPCAACFAIGRDRIEKGRGPGERRLSGQAELAKLAGKPDPEGR
jgi:hypothetical protein